VGKRTPDRLVIIMIGATVLTLAGFVPSGVALALIPLVVGLLSAFVAYGRWLWKEALLGRRKR
jgi:hypothetical protein